MQKYIPDAVERAMANGATTISLLTEERPLNHIILGQPLRGHFIRVKGMLQRAIIFYSKKYPEPTRKNCSGNWTFPFMDILDKLVGYANFKKGLFIAIRRIVLGEIEHDNLYRDPILAMLEWVIEAILDDKIQPRAEGTPDRQYWSEPPPYGGKHSIIYRILQHRKSINDILGRATINE